MNILDALALWGRRYQQQTLPSSGGPRFGLTDVMEMFDRNLILELTPVVDGKAGPRVHPDPVRKVKVSLLDDGISAIQSGRAEWYEIFRTPPSGDLSKVRIVARGPGGTKLGEIRMVVGRRTYEHYFAEDPILKHLEGRTEHN
jgi:hypothetical protein